MSPAPSPADRRERNRRLKAEMLYVLGREHFDPAQEQRFCLLVAERDRLDAARAEEES